MPRPAKGNWPKNVKAEILSPDEAAAKRKEIAHQQDNIGSEGPKADISSTSAEIPDIQHPAPGITVTQTKPHQSVQTPETSLESSESISNEDDLVYGKAALKMARRLSLPFVWDLEGNPIDLEHAEMMIEKGSKSIVFDIDRLLEVSEEIEDEQNIQEIVQNDYSDPYMNELSEIIPHALESGMISSDIPEPPPVGHHITEREKRAFGGTLSSPGMQVYLHPQGIIRADVEGPVIVQKGIQGNVRTFRITRKVTVGPTAKPAQARPVNPPQTRAPNPQATYRTFQTDQSLEEKVEKISIPKSLETEEEY